MILALFLSVTDITGVISYVNLTNSSDYQMTMRLLQTYQPDASSVLGNTGWMLTSSIVGMVLNLATIVVSYALFRRIRWGRISFISAVWLQLAYYILSSVVAYFMAESFLGNAGIAQMLGGSGIMAFGAIGAVAGGIFMVVISIFVVRKLSSPDVKREFSA